MLPIACKKEGEGAQRVGGGWRMLIICSSYRRVSVCSAENTTTTTHYSLLLLLLLLLPQYEKRIREFSSLEKIYGEGIYFTVPYCTAR